MISRTPAIPAASEPPHPRTPPAWAPPSARRPRPVWAASALLVAFAALSFGACGDDATVDADTADTATDTAEVDTHVPDVADDTAAPDTGDHDVSDAHDATDPPDVGPDTAEPGDVGPDADTTPPPFVWPWPEEAVELPAHASWKEQVRFPDDPFLSPTSFVNTPPPRWVKFLVFTGEPTRVVFQDVNAYPFHFDFAVERVPMFGGLAPEDFDALTLYHEGKRAILGALHYAPEGRVREVGVELVGRDAYPPEVVEVVLDLVRDAVTVLDGPAPALFYFPTYDQLASVEADLAYYEALGVAVSSPDRWLEGDACLAFGWAVGRLVSVAADELDAAYTSGALGPADIALLDRVPASLPPLAGVISLSSSPTGSSAALRAIGEGTPLVYLTRDESRARAQSLAGGTVALRAFGYGPPGVSACDVGLFGLETLLDPAHAAQLAAMQAPKPLAIPSKAAAGALVAPAVDLVADDLPSFGGAAVAFGLLQRAAPASAPAPAVAISFDLWEAALDEALEGAGGTLREIIAGRLEGHTWPPDAAALAADLSFIRDLVLTESVISDAAQATVLAALGAFDPDRPLQVRASTNAADIPGFVDAGLYGSVLACAAPGSAGAEPAAADCGLPPDQSLDLFDALRRVFASLYDDHAFMARLRLGVDEGQVGVGALLHPAAAEDVAAAGAVLYREQGFSRELAVAVQRGAEGVRVPAPGAVPEVALGYIYSFGTYFFFERPSNQVVLGETVLAWDSDYLALAGVLAAVAQGYAAGLPAGAHFMLDFDFSADAKGALGVHRVRPVPLPDRAMKVPTYLLPSEQPRRMCTFQGEFGDILGNHRGKLVMELGNRGAWLEPRDLELPPFHEADVELVELEAPGGTVTLSGDPATWPGWGWVAPEGGVEASWVLGEDEAARTFTLSADVVAAVEQGRNPLFSLADLYFIVGVEYASPQLDIDPWFGPSTTHEDWVLLAACPELADVTDRHILVSRRVGTAGVAEVAIDFYWPPHPTGIVAGYTAPLAAWKETRITGLTTEPIVLHGYWSQTYRPGHHNFSEEFVFEPAREPGISESILAELAEQDIELIYIDDPWGLTVKVIGADGTIRTLGGILR